MPSTRKPLTATYTAYTTSLLSLYATLTSAHAHNPSLLSPSRQPAGLRPRGLSTMTYVGCFSSSGNLTDQGTYQYQTTGYCQPICVKAEYAVLGLSGGNDCWCGEVFPAKSDLVDDSNCDTPCYGYGSTDCGGTNYWSVYTTGTEDEDAISYYGASSSTTAASSATAATTSTAATSATTDASSTTSAVTVITSAAPGTTVVITQPAAQASGGSTVTPTADHKSSTNVAGIAAGVVVGVVAAAAIIGGLVFWMKRRRSQAAEGEYKRSTQVTDFFSSGGREIKPPPTAYSQMSDSRLDPSGRRNSAGSIADEGDYSRRVLRVANPDED